MSGLYVAVLAGLAVLGAPLFVLVGAATALAFVWFTTDHGTALSLLPMIQNQEELLTRQEFLAIPLFMASGALMTAGGIAGRLVDFAKALLGWLPGGLAVAAVFACMFFAAISGSSPVTLIAVGSILFPAMVASNYPERFSIGLLTTSGSLGCLVPPSISMLIYAVTITSTSAHVDPQDLFLAGLIPAALIGGALALYAIVHGVRNPAGRTAFSWPELARATREGVWALLLPLLVLGGIYGGLYTPSEAGAVAALYALFVTVVVERQLTVRKLVATLVESSTLMGSLILIIVLAFGLNEFLAEIEVSQRLAAWIRASDLGPMGFLIVVNVLLVVIGALMDSISCTLIFAPMLAPVAYDVYGIDPLHFGVVFVVNMEIGYLMPPVATNLFVASAVFKRPFGLVTRAVLPTLAITLLALWVFIRFPTLSVAAVRAQRGESEWTLPFPSDRRAATATRSAGLQGAPVALPSAASPSVVRADNLAAVTERMFADDATPVSAPVLASETNL
ncbi:MAG: TRAP transporter large permease [Deltaproteobacteria bacterium]|nr:TRAP transporter large permease [Deltaproteobacteria bacterium]